VGPRADLDAVENKQYYSCLESNPSRPARSPSLYETELLRLLLRCFRHQKPQELTQCNVTAEPVLYCIVFLLLPFLLEHRVSVKHFCFTSVS
jgi:hypothetical protein